MNDFAYLHGFGNECASEAVPGSLPRGQFSPQQVPFGLYAEKFSATAFTVPRADNRRTWFYRIRPSVTQGTWRRLDDSLLRTAPLPEGPPPPSPLRWSPPAFDERPRDFVEALVTVAANGDVQAQRGIAVHLYDATRDMGERYFVNADGELLLVPQSGELLVLTECGAMTVGPGSIALVPRGMKFKVDLCGGRARGYVCENYGAALRLPERGPVGSDGFANARDFEIPVARYDAREQPATLFCKFQGALYAADLPASPLDVVAWVGNALPWRYDLARFNAMNTVTYDHPDPSIFTVLTAPSETVGVANLDFVIFPPRWMVAEHTFRPPWYHRNVMSEFMGLVHGQYDARKAGFEPFGMSLHNAFVPHGPDADVHRAASTAALAPQRLEHTLAFMFETRYVLNVTRWALESAALQTDYADCWAGLAAHFSAPR